MMRRKKELRKMLDDNNLKTCSDHIHVDSLQGDRFERTVELRQTLGNKLVTLSDLTGIRGNRRSAQYWVDTAKQMNELAEQLKPIGMRLGLHNHTAEFVRLEDGRVPWEIIFDNTSKGIAQQLHVGGVLADGFDPADYLKRYAGRTLTMHMHGDGRGRPPSGGRGASGQLGLSQEAQDAVGYRGEQSQRRVKGGTT